MRLVIDSIGSVSGSLHLKVCGFSIEVSDISMTGKVAVIEDAGKVSIEIIPVVEEVVSDILAGPSLEAEPLSKGVPEGKELLFNRLIALRRQIAKEVKLPPYIIFHDTSLKDMISRLPVDMEAMKDVSGVGQAKLEKYGSRFVEVIREYLAESA